VESLLLGDSTYSDGTSLMIASMATVFFILGAEPDGVHQHRPLAVVGSSEDWPVCAANIPYHPLHHHLPLRQ
jgi:hypothetical protein